MSFKQMVAFSRGRQNLWQTGCTWPFFSVMHLVEPSQALILAQVI
jgi:hypothetical protein